MLRYLLLVPVFLIGTSLNAQSVGEQLFEHNCASCHGATGRGDGPFATGLESTPADLTQIAARRDGIWPMLEVMSILDGYLKATNPREDMPVLDEFLIGQMVEFDTGRSCSFATCTTFQRKGEVS